VILAVHAIHGHELFIRRRQPVWRIFLRFLVVDGLAMRDSRAVTDFRGTISKIADREGSTGGPTEIFPHACHPTTIVGMSWTIWIPVCRTELMLAAVVCGIQSQPEFAGPVGRNIAMSTRIAKHFRCGTIASFETVVDIVPWIVRWRDVIRLYLLPCPEDVGMTKRQPSMIRLRLGTPILSTCVRCEQ
jgi:hypothetical protein